MPECLRKLKIYPPTRENWTIVWNSQNPKSHFSWQGRKVAKALQPEWFRWRASRTQNLQQPLPHSWPKILDLLHTIMAYRWPVDQGTGSWRNEGAGRKAKKQDGIPKPWILLLPFIHRLRCCGASSSYMILKIHRANSRHGYPPSTEETRPCEHTSTTGTGLQKVEHPATCSHPIIHRVLCA